MSLKVVSSLGTWDNLRVQTAGKYTQNNFSQVVTRFHKVWVAKGKPKPQSGSAARTSGYSDFQNACIQTSEDPKLRVKKATGQLVGEFKLATCDNKDWEAVDRHFRIVEDEGLQLSDFKVSSRKGTFCVVYNIHTQCLNTPHSFSLCFSLCFSFSSSTSSSTRT